MSGLGIEPPFVMHFWGGRNAPTNRPDSYEGFGRRPQFYRAEGGALIRDESQAGRGSIFPSHSCTRTSSRWLEAARVALEWCARVGDASRRVVFGRDFRRDRGSNPPTTLPRRVPLPTEPAGHGHVQPPALRSTLDIIVDPCRFCFSPLFLARFTFSSVSVP